MYRGRYKLEAEEILHVLSSKGERETETNKDRAIELQRNRYIDILYNHISILEGDMSLKLETSHELEDEEILTVLSKGERYIHKERYLS